MFQHEFPRKWREHGQPVSENWREHIEKPKSRTAVLSQKFLALNHASHKILFVREDRGELDASRRARLERSLSELFPLAGGWSLAAISGPAESGFDWRGNPVSWDAELQKLGAVLDRTGHKPFEETPAHHTDADLIDAKHGSPCD